jgi:hypothetical protein
MNTDALTNPTIKAAIEALQNGDRKAWSALFQSDAELYDDGSPRSLKGIYRRCARSRAFHFNRLRREQRAGSDRRIPLGPMGRFSDVLQVSALACG